MTMELNTDELNLSFLDRHPASAGTTKVFRGQWSTNHPILVFWFATKTDARRTC